MEHTRLRQTLADVMTTAVVSATPATPFKELARLLDEHRIGALPILDPEGRALGVVSESDLVARSVRRAAGPGWTPWARRRRRRAAGTTAAEVMSSPAITAGPGTPLPVAARLMQDRGVKHLPVVDGRGRVVGMVSRGDLLRPYLRSDDEIRRDVLDTVLRRWLWIDPTTAEVTVSEGVVGLDGQLERRSEVEVVSRVVARLDGVVGVDSRLTFREDDVRARQHPSEARVS